VTDQSFTLLPEPEVSDETLDITLRITGRNSAVIGRFLDLIEHAAALGALGCVVTAPGYQQAFYGWERQQQP
jgi:hypothetical protein